MDGRSDDLRIRKLTERALRERATLPVALLLEVSVPVAKLRELAEELALTPKGFRVEKAPASALATALAEQKDPEGLDKVMALLLDAKLSPKKPAAEVSDPAPAAADAANKFQEQELKRLQVELDRVRESLQRAGERESELRRRAQFDNEELQMLRAEIARARATETKKVSMSSAEREASTRLHDLELELEARATADDAVRRQLSLERARVRELEAEVDELLALLPKGRKRKAPPPPPEPERRIYVPWFQPSFYKSLVGKERKSVERAVQAVLLFCTEGHAYPGLEVKQLGGQSTWSMRASLGLRVYFERREDGDIDVLELADREDQHTTLRRLKER